MKKQVLWLIFLLFCASHVSAQVYGNEWIDYSRPHYKFTVTDRGIHRIPSSVLNASGLNGINPDRFRLFHEGQEVPIRVVTSGGSVTAIEFYAEPNTGGFDSLLYASGADQPNEFYSLHQDEGVYFLTYAVGSGFSRIQPITNDLTALPSPETTCRATALVQYRATFSGGKPAYIGSSTLPQAIHAVGEGWVGGNSQRFQNSAPNRNLTISSPGAVSSGPDAELYVSVLGTSQGNHDFRIEVGGTTVFDTAFSNYGLAKPRMSVPSSAISSSTTIRFRANSTSAGTNRNVVNFMELTYNRDFSFMGSNEAWFELPASATKQYIEIEDFDDGGGFPVLYDLTNGLQITAIDAPGSSTFRFALPASATPREIYIRSGGAGAVQEINGLEQLSFTNFNQLANQGNYILLTNDDFINTPELADYVSYRNASGFNVVLVNADELYDQFAYGIEKHPVAIRHFAHFADDTWAQKPEYLFIVGKGRPYQSVRSGSGASNRIPTWGDVGSDALLTASRNSSIPRVPIGRIAVTNPSQIATYLTKVIAYENELNTFGDPFQTLANKEWMKQVIHFGGGTTAGEQAIFRSYLNQYKNIIEDTLYGANVFEWFKTSSAPIEVIQSDQIANLINNGVSLITFFGHSYAGGFDIAFDTPEQYDNEGKYPVILANGCNAGLIHGGGQSVSEKFVFAPNRGAIAYIATTDFSISSSLNTYSQRFYRALADGAYEGGLGEVQQEAIALVEACCASSDRSMLVANTMTLHGDPAIRFNQYPETDYAIEPSSVLFPSDVTIAMDSFTMDLVITNLGLATSDSFNIQVTRRLPDGTENTYFKRSAGIYYKDTVPFTFPTVTSSFAGTGLNFFSIHVDVDDEITPELSETNNYLLNDEISLFISSDDIYPIHPYEFAVVPEQNVTLKASTGDPLAPVRRYIFQIDTSELFLNPLAEGSQTIGGGVVRWTPPILFADSTVYYWRVSKDSTYTGSYNWAYSSFIYLEDEFPGWNQSHYYQWQKDNYANINLENDRTFQFVDDQKEVIARTALWSGYGGQLGFEEMEWYLNGAEINSWSMAGCGYQHGFSIAIIDGSSGLPKDVINNSTTNWGPDGNFHCRSKPNVLQTANFRAYGSVPSSNPKAPASWSSVIIDYLDNNLDVGDYILVYTINNPRFDLMDPALITYLNGLGAVGLNNSLTGPYIFFARRGVPSYTPKEVITNSFTSDIAIDTFNFTGTWNEGTVSSPLIGPASDWGSFHWRFFDLDGGVSGDEQHVSLIGVTPSGSETVLSQVRNAQDTLLSFIDAATYPYLKLRLETEDNTNRTPTQLDYWRVLYDKAPEAAINPNAHLSISADTLSLGGTYDISVAVENVSEYDMDSLWGKALHQDGQNNTDIFYNINRPLPAFDTLHMKFSRSISEGRMEGSNLLILEANPLDKEHQLEQFHFNNIASFTFDVEGDIANPLLDVTFDGRHILDGEIVSPTPKIEVLLKDENEFLALDDTSLVQIWFRNTETGQLTHMPFSSPDVQFFPADPSELSERNEARVSLEHEFTQNGIYELIISGRDRSGNSSSNAADRIIAQNRYDYKISFEVIRESMVTHVLNYPNPFTTQTKFVFTLTGTELPDYFKIRIFNVSGTVVKEIDQTELGPLHIGLNVTDYAWNGTDEWGDPLANGVYFYQVITSLNGEEIEHMEIDQLNQYFKKGIGKMVLVR